MTITKYCVYIVYIVCVECLFFYNYYHTKDLEGLDFLFFFLYLHFFSCSTVYTNVSLSIAHHYMQHCLQCHLVEDHI